MRLGFVQDLCVMQVVVHEYIFILLFHVFNVVTYITLIVMEV